MLYHLSSSWLISQSKLWEILKEMRIPNHLTCLLRNQYAGQEATDRILQEQLNWFKVGKGI